MTDMADTQPAAPLPFSDEEMARIRDDPSWSNYGLRLIATIDARQATIAAKDAEISDLKTERDTYKETCDDSFNQLVALWAERDALKAEVTRLTISLEIIAGIRPAFDNLMGNRDIALATLTPKEN